MVRFTPLAVIIGVVKNGPNVSKIVIDRIRYYIIHNDLYCKYHHFIPDYVTIYH